MLKDTTENRYGTSVTLCDYILEHQIAEIKPEAIVDFGAGGGKMGKLSREVLGEKVYLIAVEGHKETVDMLNRQLVYDRVCHNLIQDWVNINHDTYDLAIFGDVLEHLKPKEIHRAIKKCLACFKQIIIICPINDIFQGAALGNSLNVHRTYVMIDFFDRYNLAEKHIVRGKRYTIMNVRISSAPEQRYIKRDLFWSVFHRCMHVLQPVGLAGPFMALLKRTVFRRRKIYQVINTKIR
jgi:hypothetical protein